MESCHASGGCTTAGREDISDVNILDKCRVKVDLSVDCAENA